MEEKTGKNLFFLGKGGTGKTTIAAITALGLAEKGKKVAIFSIDPAHNLFDILQIKSPKSTVKLRDNLIVEEIDIQFWIKTYLKSIEDKIARTYQHLTALSLEKHLNTIRYSPGLEEYALQYAFEAVIKKYRRYDYIVFDMPPTALALRFFNLPKLTLVWLEELIILRRKILEKKNIIDDVHRRNKKKSGDKVLDKLIEMKNSNQDNVVNFQNEKSTGIYIVLNEDQLSILESTDIYDSITFNKFCVKGILINKYQNHLKINDVTQNFSKLPSYFIPYIKDALIGEKKLLAFLKHIELRPFFDAVLTTTNI
jgi:arsenite-transporting ATPase